ncbi:uncharacterized protein SPSK_06622 [Sporothrix schenckii 1099-18]|uniref:DUF1770 domain-containing protein n=2 Tax=Sporothrix schenckii TaxID=29908 RepID=U7PTI2_SPOS1|nr:uncharacterized protein SPSK_06622 [Sporothrix schenckii 1099-18]ERS98059.1 hypothetical protein HMPREF1624_04837 [Sporothrix schenckii ATCC 58251]KJR89872.1 hypothetical protein SPSK_06622 [Sporothrix schenckii 1099-18]
MSSSVPLQIAETLQTAHIVHNPSAERDLAPSTAADVREPVVLETVSGRKTRRHGAVPELDEDPLELDALDDEEDEGEGEAGESPYSIIRPWDPTVDRSTHYGGRASSRPHQQLPPLPDLRFEQSYLHSLAAADTWWKVGLVTVRDQLLMPFVQGLLYNLAVCGWQYWNRASKLSGQSVGARVRRWWWGVNNWTIPGTGALATVASAAERRPVNTQY